MKQIFLLFIVLLSFTDYSIGQKDRFVRTQQNIFTVSYNPESTDSIQLPNIHIFPDTAQMDTCFWKNCVITKIKIRNNTPYELMIAKELTCWDDSGFHPVSPTNTDLIVLIKPGKQEEITIRVMNHGRRRYHKAGSYFLSCNQQVFTGTINLKMTFKPSNCGGF